MAGLTLLVVRKESSAFWIFVALLQTMASYYTGSLAYVREDLDRLAALTRNQIPRLAAHFASLGFTDYSVCFPKWLLCLFVSVLKTPLLLKTLDNFFATGATAGTSSYRRVSARVPRIAAPNVPH